MTLTEVLVASALLGVALVPVFEALSRGMGLARAIEWRSRAVFLAEQEMERITNENAENFNKSVAVASKDLGGGFLATIEEGSKTSLAKTVSVRVGKDTSGDGTLATSEVLATLVTRVANVTDDVE